MAHVVIIDDQLISRMILEELIKSIDSNLQVQSFEDPVPALDWVKHNPVDLILTDYKMPTMDGVKFTQWLRQIPRCADVPLVIITCIDAKELRYRALEAGATDFLTKPIDHNECKARCRNLLKLREQQSIIKDRAHWLERQVEDKMQQMRIRERESLARLARVVEVHDNNTKGHGRQLAFTSRLIAESMGMDKHFCDTLEHAAPLHDVGIIAIPHDVLHKPEVLTSDERQLMMRHTRYGYDLLRDSHSEYLRMGATLAWCHHEQYDGNGYPRGLKGDAIPVEASIVGLADVFDALLSERPHKKPWSLDKTVSYIQDNRGTRYAPSVVDGLMDKLDRITTTRQLLSEEQSDGSSANLA